MKSSKKKIQKYIIGIDVGGTTCKIALFTSDMEIIKKWQIDTDKNNNGKNIIKQCVASILIYLLKEGIDKKEVIGIGVDVPGPVLDESIVVKAVNVGWKKPNNIKKEIEKYFGKNIKVKVANDADAAAYGEYRVLNDKKIKSLVMVTLGTGIGGGFVYNGEIYNGKNGNAMEIGHIKVDTTETAKKCNCGSKGCAETFGATNAIKESFLFNLLDKNLSNMKSAFRTDKNINLDEITTKNICDAAKKGDELCLYTLKKAMWYVGYMLSNVILVLDPDMIVVGGGVSQCGNMLAKFIKESVKENMKMLEKLPEIKISKLKNEAGIYGAGYLVKE